MKSVWRLSSVLLIIVALVGCREAEPTTAVATGAETNTGMPRGGIDPTNALALGTFRLEGSENAVTAEQAAKMLPLWTIINSGSLQGNAETQAVLDQIEVQMTEDQLAAIEAMDLTFEDMGTWMEEQGIEMPARPEGGMPGGGGAFGDMTEEERTKIREEFQSMTQEERATRMAEMGFERPEGGGQGGRQGGGPGGGQAGQGTRPGGGTRGGMLIGPLIELLTKRAGQ